MPTLETFAARFARCVSLFRDPAAKDEQKAEFRALLGLLHDVAVTLRVSAGRLEVNGTPAGGGGGGVVGLLQRLDLHGISEIALPRDPPPAQLFELLRVLADQPGLEDVPSRLRGAGVDRIHVTQAPALPPPPPPPPPPPRPPRPPSPRRQPAASSRATRSHRPTRPALLRRSRSAPTASSGANRGRTFGRCRSRACRW